MSEDEIDIEDVDSMIFTCWCGAKGTYDELFDDSGLPDRCGGLGMMVCECGGSSLCVCHRHGEVPCDGCEDCEDDWDDDDFYEEDD